MFVPPFAEFKSKFQLKKTTFLHFFQVISAIPSHLLQRARELKVSLDDSKFYDDSDQRKQLLGFDESKSQGFLLAVSK